MNVRKPVDYGAMYRELSAILAQNLPQMDEIYAIGKTISQRPEKGAAVAAAEILQANFPDRTGFSPRNVRQIRDFYKTYENGQTRLRLAMKIGWTLNVVIMEAELTSVQRISCLQRAAAERLSKKNLSEWTVIRSGQWRYRMEDCRLICLIQDNELVILALTAGYRSGANGESRKTKRFVKERGKSGRGEADYLAAACAFSTKTAGKFERTAS